MTFKEFLERRFLDWQSQQGARKTVAEYADWLGVKRSTLSMWWNAEITPRDDGVISKLAVKLGLELYDILQLERPNEDLFYVQQHWERLSPEKQRAVAKDVEGYISGNEAKRSRRPKAARG